MNNFFLVKSCPSSDNIYFQEIISGVAFLVKIFHSHRIDMQFILFSLSLLSRYLDRWCVAITFHILVLCQLLVELSKESWIRIWIAIREIGKKRFVLGLDLLVKMRFLLMQTWSAFLWVKNILTETCRYICGILKRLFYNILCMIFVEFRRPICNE